MLPARIPTGTASVAVWRVLRAYHPGPAGARRVEMPSKDKSEAKEARQEAAPVDKTGDRPMSQDPRVKVFRELGSSLNEPTYLGNSMSGALTRTVLGVRPGYSVLRGSAGADASGWRMMGRCWEWEGWGGGGQAPQWREPGYGKANRGCRVHTGAPAPLSAVRTNVLHPPLLPADGQYERSSPRFSYNSLSDPVDGFLQVQPGGGGEWPKSSPASAAASEGSCARRACDNLPLALPHSHFIRAVTPQNSLSGDSNYQLPTALQTRRGIRGQVRGHTGTCR